jgi:diphthamide synthase subunit DPH2
MRRRLRDGPGRPRKWHSSILNALLRMLSGRDRRVCVCEAISFMRQAKEDQKKLAEESIPFLVDNAKRHPMSLTPRSRIVGCSMRSLAEAQRAAVAGAGSP